MTPKQDESAVPERVWVDSTSYAICSIYPRSDGVEYLRKQSVIDRLKKKRDEWQRERETVVSVTAHDALSQRMFAANELIAEFEKE